MPEQRAKALQAFLTATEAAIDARVKPGSPAAKAMRTIAVRLAAPAARHERPPQSVFAVCDHLLPALAIARSGPPDIGRVADALATLAPVLSWRSRPSDDPVFAAGHANATIVGPEPAALERREDVRVGISLVAPGITYPDHQHPPEEVYLVLSGGDWRQGSDPWHTPGRGGIVYNPPDIVHAMRAGAEPLLAIWCLSGIWQQ